MSEYIVERASSFGVSAICRLATFGYYDWQGYLPIGNIMLCLLNMNRLSFQYGFMDKCRLEDENGILLFLIRFKVSLTEEFYQKTRRYNQQDLSVSSKVLSLGKSSVCTNITVQDKENRKELSKCHIKIVLVDSKTRRPCNIPSWFCEKYGKRAEKINTSDFQKSDILRLPEHVFSSTVRTRYENIDTNNHVTTSEYVQYCLECATAASLAGFYRYFNSNMAAHPVLELDATFVEECGANEDLTVKTWQDEKDVQIINFRIYLNDKLLFHASAIFRKEQLPPSKVFNNIAKL